MIETRYGPTELEAVAIKLSEPRSLKYSPIALKLLIIMIILLNNMVPKSFMYDGAYIWNSIPKEIQRESKSLSFFRKKIAAHID
jgi:hypothetical protein